MKKGKPITLEELLKLRDIMMSLREFSGDLIEFTEKHIFAKAMKRSLDICINEINEVTHELHHDIDKMKKVNFNKGVENMNLSEKEKKLYEFIKNSDEPVTVKKIIEKLGESYTGAVGRLVREELVTKTKIRIKNDYGTDKFLTAWEVENKKGE